MGYHGETRNSTQRDDTAEPVTSLGSFGRAASPGTIAGLLGHSRVIASEGSQGSRLVRDFSATVERIVDDNEIGLHILAMSLALEADDHDPYTRAFLQVAATFAELEAEIKRQNIRDGIAARTDMDKWHGRPPFGFEIGPEGYLAPDDEYDTAVAILDALDNDESKRALARTTGVPPSTIQEIEKKRDLYA